LPAHAIHEVRELYRASEGNTLPEQLALERERQTELADGPAFAEGVRAFLGKRKPQFAPR
jgi:2-(1,2-epoxy-1,2-dihydrophenyl)acetyl-CoA isomerase